VGAQIKAKLNTSSCRNFLFKFIILSLCLAWLKLAENGFFNDFVIIWEIDKIARLRADSLVFTGFSLKNRVSSHLFD
jgi:hypothetical protein